MVQLETLVTATKEDSQSRRHRAQPKVGIAPFLTPNPPISPSQAPAQKKNEKPLHIV